MARELDRAPTHSFSAAVRPWAFTDAHGRAHEAKALGFESALSWVDIFEWSGNDPWRMQHTVNRFVRALYPPKWRYWCTFRSRRWPVVGVALALLTLLAWWNGRALALRVSGLGALALVVSGALASLAYWIAPGIPDPVAEFLRMDGPSQSAAITDFFLHAGLRIPAPRIPTSPKASKTFAGASPPRPTASAVRGG